MEMRHIFVVQAIPPHRHTCRFWDRSCFECYVDFLIYTCLPKGHFLFAFKVKGEKIEQVWMVCIHMFFNGLPGCGVRGPLTVIFDGWPYLCEDKSEFV